MLNRINEWLSKQHHLLPSANGLICLTSSETDLYVAYATKKSTHLELQLCDKISLPKNFNFSVILSPIVEKLRIENTPCIWILEPKDYQIFLMETLPVPEEEFQSAIRWKMKSLLSFELEDAVIDKIYMPIQKGANAQKMMTVIAAKKSYLEKITKQIKLSRLSMQVIDIEELALRNVTSKFETDEKSSALIYLQDHHCDFLITRQHELYFSRRIEMDLPLLQSPSGDEDHLLEKLALEVQRSFDYFQSQWRSQIPERIFLVAPRVTSINIADALSQYLGALVKQLELSQIISSVPGLDLEQKTEYLPLIGGLLRNS